MGQFWPLPLRWLSHMRFGATVCSALGLSAHPSPEVLSYDRTTLVTSLLSSLSSQTAVGLSDAGRGVPQTTKFTTARPTWIGGGTDHAEKLAGASTRHVE